MLGRRRTDSRHLKGIPACWCHVCMCDVGGIPPQSRARVCIIHDFVSLGTQCFPSDNKEFLLEDLQFPPPPASASFQATADYYLPNMFGKSSAPARVPSDTVVPFRFFDDTPLWRAFILYSTFVFDDVLDPSKLRDSLEALAKRDGWRKLGARLRRSVR